MTSDGACKSLDETHCICHIVATHETLGSTTLTETIEFDDEDSWDGTSNFVFTGGTDHYAGIMGKVTGILKEDNDVVANRVCIQKPVHPET